MKVPKTALQLTENNQCSFNDKSHDAKLKMTVYSGNIIRNHWFWKNLAIDLSGLQFHKNNYPILSEHDLSQKIAVSGKPAINGNKLTIDPDSTLFLDTPAAHEFISLSKQGFPYQASMRVHPSNIEHLGEGDTAEVNGYTMQGPGAIFRKSEFKEASVCVFGADSRTRSTALKEGDDMINIPDDNEIAEDLKAAEKCAEELFQLSQANCRIDEDFDDNQAELLANELFACMR